MTRILIIGIESIVGANLAAVYSETHEVSGLSAVNGVQIANCRITPVNRLDAATLQQHLQAAHPEWVIFCGSAARSCWEQTTAGFDDSLAVSCAQAAAKAGCDFTMISSDAIFSGPWMSHAEDDEHYCGTPQAARLRQIEAEVMSAHEDALIVRTNAFGWSPLADQPGFAESVLQMLERADTQSLDFLRHSAPILATDLAELLLKVQHTNVCGVLHLAGAERINPLSFAERLAQEAGLRLPRTERQAALSEPVTGFGCGETTLSCRTACSVLGQGMPLISESLSRFLGQLQDGFRDRLRTAQTSLSRVA